MNNIPNPPTLAEQIQSLFAKIGEIAQHSIFDLMKLVRQISPELRDYSDKELQDALKIAWNYEEENTELFTLKDAIVWMKENFNRSLYSGGCIYKLEPNLVQNNTIDHPVDVDDDGKPQISSEDACHDTNGSKEIQVKCLHLCFLDKEGNPLLDGEARHKVVYCNMIDDTLSRQFGDKNMIVLK